MKHLTDLEKWKLLVKSDVNQAASDFGDRASEDASRMAETLGAAYMVNVVSQLASDAAADLLRNLPEDFRVKVLGELSPDKAAALKEILSYESGTAGALMAKEHLSVPLHFTIRQATEYLQSIPQDKRSKVSYIYVVDGQRRLEGVIQIRDLVFYPPDRSVKDILIGPVVQVETGMSQLDVARLLQRHRYLGLPVVDRNQRLVGVISADSAMQAMEEESSDDIAKIVGTSAEEIRAGSALQIVRLRLPWLLVNIASGILCALISGTFEQSLPTVATLFLFVPVVLGLSESTGVQGATIVVRNLALGNLEMKKLRSLFVRETFAGIAVGSICGLIVGFFASYWKASPRIGLSLAASLTLAISISALVGLALPLIFRRFKIDPAIASGPLVLAICDIQALFVYFNLSGLILRR